MACGIFTACRGRAKRSGSSPISNRWRVTCAIRTGLVRGPASFSSARLSVVPDLPAVGELGYRDMDVAAILGVVAPKDTPREIVANLNAEIVRALRDPQVNGKLIELGVEVVGDTPEHFAAFLQSEARRWLPFIRSLNIRLG